MLVSRIHCGSSIIEFYNSFLGQETIVINGEVVSSKHSFTGTEHQFNVLEDGQLVHFKLTTGVGIHGITVDLEREGQPILQSSKTGCSAILILLLIFLGCLIFLMGIIG